MLMKPTLAGLLAISLLPACGGDKSPPPGFGVDTDAGENSEQGNSAGSITAGSRPEGEVPEVEYGSGSNVAGVEDRGANCGLPDLASFSELEEQPLLPDPFLSFDGTRITDKLSWTCRRAEISAHVQEYELGPKPAPPEQVESELGDGVIDVTVEDAGESISFSATITLPEAGDEPYPAMIVLGGQTALDTEGNISGQGVAMIDFPHDEIAEQAGGQSRGQGLFYDLYGSDHPAGALTAWAWGVSRLIDALEKTPEANIDTTRLGVTGCSRNGKGALVVGALDERIALTLPQESGAGGSALWRMAEVHHQQWLDAGMMPDYADVQTLSHAANENVWFRQSFGQFGSAVERLPFDHHMVMGLLAPRGLLMVNNTEQYWLDREGSHFGAVFAHSIWEALGVPENMGGSQVGSSTHCADVPSLQLEHVAAYVKKFLLGDDTADTEVLYTDGGFSDVSEDWIDWETPQLE